MSAATGAVGLLAEANSHSFVDHFRMNEEPSQGTLAYLHTDAWLGAGENPADWIEQRDPRFRFGIGAVRRVAGGRVKWNFVGTDFTLWSPTGPEYGSVEVRLDGALVATVDLHNAQQRPSTPVFTKKGMADTFHAVVLRTKTGRLVVDSLDAGS